MRPGGEPVTNYDAGRSASQKWHFSAHLLVRVNEPKPLLSTCDQQTPCPSRRTLCSVAICWFGRATLLTAPCALQQLVVGGRSAESYFLLSSRSHSVSGLIDLDLCGRPNPSSPLASRRCRLPSRQSTLISQLSCAEKSWLARCSADGIVGLVGRGQQGQLSQAAPAPAFRRLFGGLSAAGVCISRRSTCRFGDASLGL